MAPHRATVWRTAAALAALCATRTRAQPGACNFSIPLTSLHCFGLDAVPGAATAAACAAAACAAGAQAWEFCPPATRCDTFTGPLCWAGSTQVPACAAGRAGFVGGASSAAPPPAPSPTPLPPQAFAAPCAATAPLALLDLADARGGAAGGVGAWTLAIDGGAPRAVAVPGGGFASDAQAPPRVAGLAVKSSAVYVRNFTAPAAPADAALFLSFGAVNHGARVLLRAAGSAAAPALVGVHYGPMMPFDVDVSRAVAPGGGAYELTVEALPYAALAGRVPSGFQYAEAWASGGDGWASRACAGICKSVALVALPRVRVARVAVAARWAARAATFDIELANDSEEAFAAGALVLAAALSPWNAGAAWPYPPLPLLPLPALPARGAARANFTLDVSALPEAAWWWPNRPFNETYTASLHFFNSTLARAAGGAPLSSASARFGLVEHAEGGPFYYTLNGVRVNQLSDATPENAMSFYDAYAEPVGDAGSAAFTAAGGAAETWRRYMRLGVTSNRIHQSTPTRAMLDAADEVGFLLKPETPIRGTCNYAPCAAGGPDLGLFSQSVAELVRATGAHPCVFAFSLENESNGPAALVPALIDAAAAAGAAVPLTTEGSPGGSDAVTRGATSSRHAVNLYHYAEPDASRAELRGVGECAWCVVNGLEQFAGLALRGRLVDATYYAGWDLANYWPNFFEGMSAARHAWKQAGCNGTDRVDGVNGWGSPVVEWVQRAFHAFAVVDEAALAANPIFTRPGWPYVVDTLAAGARVNRSVALFNDVLAATRAPWAPDAAALFLRWSAAWDAPDGPVAVAGATVALSAAPGFTATTRVAFDAPPPGAGAPPGGRALFLVLASVDAAGAVRYVEDRVSVRVTAP